MSLGPYLIGCAFSIVLLLIPLYVKEHFLLPLMSLIRLNSNWALAFLTVSACLDLVDIPPRLPVPDSTFFMLPFYVLIWSAATCSSTLTSWHFWTSSCLLRWTVVKLGDDPLIFISFLGSLFSAGLYPMGHFQADTWRASLLFCSPELWSSFLPTFNPFTILNTPIIVTTAKATFCLHSRRVFLFLWVWAEHLFLLFFLSLRTGRCHWCSPRSSCTVYALLHSPSGLKCPPRHAGLWMWSYFKIWARNWTRNFSCPNCILWSCDACTFLGLSYDHLWFSPVGRDHSAARGDFLSGQYAISVGLLTGQGLCVAPQNDLQMNWVCMAKFW